MASSTEHFDPLWQCEARIVVRGDFVVVDIERAAGIPATRSWQKGDSFVSRSRTFQRTYSAWSVETERSGDEPATHLRRLLDRVSDALPRLRAAVDRLPGVEFDLSLYIWSPDGVTGIGVPADLLAHFSRYVHVVGLSSVPSYEPKDDPPYPPYPVFEALERWYAGQCHGEWEHLQGVKIGTLDNPGWSVEIDLSETPLDRHSFDRITLDRTDSDWVRCWVENNTFRGTGGPANLREIVWHFLTWSRRTAPPVP